MSSAYVNIQSLAHGGDGVAKLPDGRTVFVPYSCPGDEASIIITEEHDRWARGKIEEISSPSLSRVKPPCPYFGVCGGCQWQHIDYAAQLGAKRQNLVDALARIGHLEGAEVMPAVASPREYGYRNKIELSATQGKGGLTLGFMRAHSEEVLRVDSCLLLPERNRDLPKALAGALRFAASRGAEGVTRASARASATGEVAIDIWTTGGPFPRNAAARVIAQATGAKTVTRTIMRQNGDARDISRVEVLSGSGIWSERLGGYSYTLSAPSFFQVNTKAAELLQRAVMDALEPDGSMRIADLYAGVGTFTVPISELAGETVAVEASRYALADLRRNLELAGTDADVVPGDAAHALPELGHLDAVVIDPPRSGLSEHALSALAAARVARVVYVSCDPATLARDLGKLSAAGYTARRFTPVDMFPQTFHLETVALLELG